MELNRVKFTPPKSVGGLSHPTPHLYVANCGPAVGLSLERIAAAFGTFGTVIGVQVADESGTRVVVTFRGIAPAQAAKEAWDGIPCSYLDAHVLHMQYSVPQAPCQVEDSLSVFRVSSEMGIPGIFLFHDFVSEPEEHELLAAVDERPWQGLMKRRVQHYGYEFMYKTRNVDTKQYLGQLPVFLSELLNRMALLPEVNQAENSLPLDQLTVDIINGERIRRSSRRVSFTFRKVRFGPCNCRFQQYCDSQNQVIDRLGQPELKTATNREHEQGIACLEE